MRSTAWWTVERRAAASARQAAIVRESSPLTWDDVRDIRARAAAAEKHEVIAAHYGLERAAASMIIGNRRWHDPDYTPGYERECKECGNAFWTTRMNRRFCSPACRGVFNSRRAGGFRRRGECTRYRRPRETRLETPIEHGELAALIADPHAADPLAALDRSVLRDVVGDLDAADIDRLDPDTLRELRKRLARVGLVPKVRPTETCVSHAQSVML